MERMVEIERFEGESSYEVSLRPSRWDEYIGQEKIKKNLQVFIEASKKRGEALDHILFLDLLGLVRRLWQISSHLRWEPTSKQQQHR